MSSSTDSGSVSELSIESSYEEDDAPKKGEREEELKVDLGKGIDVPLDFYLNNNYQSVRD
jgi:hypothetical protein